MPPLSVSLCLIGALLLTFGALLTAGGLRHRTGSASPVPTAYKRLLLVRALILTASVSAMNSGLWYGWLLHDREPGVALVIASFTAVSALPTGSAWVEYIKARRGGR